MKSRYIILAVFVAGAALLAQPVHAHGFGERTELPVPLGFFLIGAGVTVGLSFAIIGLFAGGTTGHGSYWRYNLYQHRWLRSVLTSRFLLLPVKLLVVFLFGLVIATGFFGNQIPSSNFAPTFVWIIWWVGMGFVVALVGNLWTLINPWKILFEWAEGLGRLLKPGSHLSLMRPYPENWGIWPALLLFLSFTWIQDAFVQSPLPNRVAVLTIIYSLITLGGITIFGKQQWLRHGEAFSVVFSFLAKFAPTEVRVRDTGLCSTCGGDCLSSNGDCVNCYECFSRSETKELNIRPFAIGLADNEGKTNDVLAMVVLLLATVTFDGFSATQIWVDIQTVAVDIFIGVANGATFNGRTIADSLGVLLFPVGFFLIYLTFSRFIAVSAERGLNGADLAKTCAYAIIGVALAYDSVVIIIDVANGADFGNRRTILGILLGRTTILELLLSPVGFFLIYLTFSRFISEPAESELSAMAIARTFAYSLIPIALAYNIAHFITLLLIQGQLIIPLASDPFGFGWDLLGTGDYRINIGIINAKILWYLSVGLIVAGHIIAVYLAHLISLRTFQDRSAAISSQYPMLMLMVIYTVVSLWTIAQPIVA